MKKLLLLLLSAHVITHQAKAQTAFHDLMIKGHCINTLSGNGIEGFAGDGNNARSAMLNSPADVATDTLGNLYIADWYNARIRKIDTRGIITTIAGTGTIGYSGDAGPATAAKINYPNRIAADRFGNLYFADVFYNSIRKIDTGGIITTFAGNGKAGYTGDNEPAIFASLNYPSGIACDKYGNVYISDRLNNCIRKVNVDGIITTVAGTGIPGNSGDGLAATSANITLPNGIAVDDSGNLYTPTTDHYVRKISVTGIISTIAGNGTTGYTANSDTATSTPLSNPIAIAVDTAGVVYIADYDNHKVLQLNKKGQISTFAGINKEGFAGDGSNALTAQLNNPNGIAVDRRGVLYISDNGNNRIRTVSTCSWPVAIKKVKPDQLMTQQTYTPPPFNNLRNNVTNVYIAPATYLNPVNSGGSGGSQPSMNVPTRSGGGTPRPIRKG